MSSRIPKFYRLHPDARRAAIVERSPLEGADAEGWLEAGLSLDTADLMIENVVGLFALPQGVAVNFLIDGEDVLVPMAVEEPSVVAACSNMARITRAAGGITTEVDPSVMIGQVQITDVADPHAAAEAVRAAIPELEERCRGVHKIVESLGGGIRGMEVRLVTYDEPGEAPETMVVLHFFMDCVDAMGANMINTLAEGMGPRLEALTGGTTRLHILSNLADRRIARARVKIPARLLATDALSGEEVAAGIASAYRFAWADPYRAATHNKGIMNGIDAVAIATGNDWRAIEAGAHAYAARDGQYRSLSSWKIDDDGDLCGELALPMAVGVVGGPIKVHPTVQANLKMMGEPRARRLAGIITAAGLAQNMGALRALATEGIQRGHMRMHARSVAVTAGAPLELVAAVAARLAETHDYSLDNARAVIAELQSS